MVREVRNRPALPRRETAATAPLPRLCAAGRDMARPSLLSVAGMIMAIFVATPYAKAAPAASAATSTAPASGGAAGRESFEDWELGCTEKDKKNVCAVIQQIGHQQDQVNQRLLAIELTPEGDGARVTLILPFGLDLAKGATLKIGSEEGGVTIPYRTCITAGCLLSFQLTGKALKSMREQPSLTVSSYILSSAERVAIPVSLKGFAAAWDQAVRRQS